MKVKPIKKRVKKVADNIPDIPINSNLEPKIIDNSYLREVEEKLILELVSDSNKITMKKMWETGKLNYKSKYADSKIEEYKGIQYQGNYELDFLKEMEKYGLLSLIERGPVIEYMDSTGKNRLYLVDFKIKNTDLLIEIKSSYTIKINSKNNHLKFEFAKKHGNFIIIIDKDYSDLRKKINEYGISKF